MNQSRCMRRSEPFGDLRPDINQRFRAERAASQQIAQRLSVDEFRDEIMHALLLAGVVDGKYVRMIERARGARLLVEAADAAWILAECFRQNLERDLAAQSRIASAVDFAHAASAKRA